MNWLARLKKIDTPPTTEATETTKRVSVVFVAPGMAPMQKTGADSPAANDPANAERDAPKNLIKPHIAAAVIDVALDPDRWAWPHSEAMADREIDTFTARLHHFTRRGLAEPDAERLADKLVKRDREADDRRLCLECVHLAGHAAGAWGCRNWQRAGVAIKARDAGLSAALVYQPQRCDGFTDQNQQRTTS